jgi:hypothetical protein
MNVVILWTYLVSTRLLDGNLDAFMTAAACTGKKAKDYLFGKKDKIPYSYYSVDQFAYLVSSPEIFYYAMQKMGLLSNYQACSKCGSSCELRQRVRRLIDRAGSENQYEWFCSCDTKHNFTRSIRYLSMFTHDHDPRKLFQTIYYLLHNSPPQAIHEITGLASSTITQTLQWLQKLASVMNGHFNVCVGGGVRGNATELDAFYFGGLRSSKQGYGGVRLGRERYTKQAIMTNQERGGRRVLFAGAKMAENQQNFNDFAATVTPGSTVFADGGAALFGVQNVVKGKFFAVKHNKHFVHPLTRVHSSTAESRHRAVRWWLGRRGHNFRGNSEDQLWNNLSEYVWRQWWGDGSGTVNFGMFMLAIFDQHGFMPVTTSNQPPFIAWFLACDQFLLLTHM